MNTLEQFAVVDALLSNWSEILIKMGPASAARAAEIARISHTLANVSATDEIPEVLDDLQDLLDGTPASDYVRSLLARASNTSIAGTPGLGIAPRGQPHAGGPQADAIVPDLLSSAAKTLGRRVGLAAGQDTIPAPVFFATNREARNGGKPEEMFSGELAEAVTFGLATVTIPAEHTTGLQTPAWWNVVADRKDSSRYVVFNQIETLDGPEFCTRLGAAVTNNGRGSLLIFLHGYRVTFEEAARRAAQFAYDLNFKGAVLLFSWPSLGRAFAYGADEERSALSSEPFNALLKILEHGPWDKVHIVAHSMGNRVLVSALADHPPPTLQLGQIVFVAADVSIGVFERKFPRLATLGTLKTSYVSKADRALALSSWLHKMPRIGTYDEFPYAPPGLETIDATNVDSSLISMGHSYFGDKRSVVSDLQYLLNQGLAAGSRDLRQSPGEDYWRFPS